MTLLFCKYDICIISFRKKILCWDFKIALFPITYFVTIYIALKEKTKYRKVH